MTPIGLGLGARSALGYGVGVSAPGGAAAGNGLLNNLVAYWALDEAAGANDAIDKHTNALTLTQVSSPGSAAGKVYSGARTFDGAADYFIRASNTLLQMGDVDFTFAAWVYFSDISSTRTILSKRNTLYEYGLNYSAGDSNFQWAVSGNGSVTTQLKVVSAATFGAASINTWYLVIAHHDAVGNTIGISINNGTLDTAAHTYGVFAGTMAYNIGRAGYGAEYHNGRLGPVAMWKSSPGAGGVLTAAQRTALYAGGNGLAYASFTT